MKTRISRSDLAMEIARLFAKRGTCGRKQVGCVLMNEGRVIASGYNGTLPGDSHCSLIDPKSDKECDPLISCDRAVHAEANMISYCAKHGIKTMDSTLFVTTLPCKKCAELIIQAGIKEIFYDDGYNKNSDYTVKEIFMKAGVTISQI